MQRFHHRHALANAAPVSAPEPEGAYGTAPPPGPEGPAFIGTMSPAVPNVRGGPGPASLGLEGRLPPELTDPKRLARQSARARAMARLDPAQYCRQRILQNRPTGGACKTLMGQRGAG